MQFGTFLSVNRSASQPPTVGRRQTREQDTYRCRNGLAEVLCVRTEREVEERGIDDADRERAGRIHIDINPQMILELAEDVEAATSDALPEDRTAGLYQRAPRKSICAACVGIETIGNDRVASGTQHDCQAFAEWGEARGVMHQGRLKCNVVFDASGIVEEWIVCGGGVEKRLVTSNRST